MLVLGRAIITVELIDYRGATSDPIKGAAGRSNKEYRISKDWEIYGF
jgi:hypothetical protein